MNSTIFPIVFVILAIAIPLAVLILVVRWQQKRTHQNAQALASELGLQYLFSTQSWYRLFQTPYLQGTLQNRPVQISTYTVSTGNSQQSWAQVRVRLPQNRTLKFSIAPRTILSGLTEMISSSVVKTGDVKFDASFAIKCNERAFVEATFFPEVRERFAATWAQNNFKGSIALDGEMLKYAERGGFSGKKTCEHMSTATRLLLEIATWVDAYNEASPDRQG